MACLGVSCIVHMLYPGLTSRCILALFLIIEVGS